MSLHQALTLSTGALTPSIWRVGDSRARTGRGPCSECQGSTSQAFESRRCEILYARPCNVRFFGVGCDKRSAGNCVEERPQLKESWYIR